MKYIFLGLPRIYKQLIAATLDLVFLPLMFYCALALHVDTLRPQELEGFGSWALAVPMTAIPVFAMCGLYRAVVRYIDQRIIGTVMLGTTLSVILMAEVVQRVLDLPTSNTVFLIYWVNAVLYMLTSRFIARGLFISATTGPSRKRVAIYGAGKAGHMLAAALQSSHDYEPVIFIDDNPQLKRTTIGGIKVYSSNQLAHVTALNGIDTVLLAIPSLTRQRQSEILDRLAALKLNVKVTPPIGNIIRGLSKVQDVRQVDVEDLLGRDSVEPHPDLLAGCITGKAVMVSGAGGSIGSELCRQILRLAPSRLVLLDLSEFALYSIDQELQNMRASLQLQVEIVPFIGSVQDYEKCFRILSTFEIDTVYHAAAYKHVPLVEFNPVEGIRNNAFGTLKMARAAMAAKVKCFVLVSTDKAVRPTNVMGATKRLAELVLQAFARQGSATRFCMVRFGNVLGSSGSVVPLFRKQIAAGGPVTLTHPEITRYFMTIPEAAQLVIQAGSMGIGGDVFVLDMGEPVRIADLAKRMIHLSGKEVKAPATPHGTIEIEYVGLRPGEKLYEELLIGGGNVSGTTHPLIMRAEENEIDWRFLEVMLKQLDDACNRDDQETIRAMLTKIVKEYQPSSEISDLIWCERSVADEEQAEELA